MQPAVSIIVAMYKVERYLATCLDSLLAGTLREVEFILVNDGSPDQCGAIAEEYARRDPRIRVIHQENRGVSHARNQGVQLAGGEYIGFVDPDDWVEADLYAELYAAARAGDADGCICSFYECYEEEAKTILIRYPFLPPLSIGQTQVFASVMLPLFTGRLHSFTWNKLYRRSLLLQHNVQSPEDMQLMEDALFNQDALGIMERVAYVDRPLYYYRRHPASVTMNFRADLFDTLLRLLWARERYLHQTTAPPHAAEQVNGWFIDELLRAFQAECSAARRMPPAESTRRIRRMVNDADVRRLLPASQAGRNPFERALLLAIKLRSIAAVRVAAFSLRLARMALRWLKETAVAWIPGRRQMMPEGGERL